MYPNPETPSPADINALRRTLKPYARAAYGPALWQLASTLAAYLALWALMAVMARHDAPWWIYPLPVLVAAGLLVRIFIFFHDCCHGSFLPSQRANRIVGYVTGTLTFTPFEAWARSHLIHHGSYANLDRRGVGDIWTMTLQEYRAASWSRRLAYRLCRNPLVFLLLGPLYTFVVSQRFFARGQGRAERVSVLATNGLILLVALAGWLAMGLAAYFWVQLAVLLGAGSIGIWLFYVQHQFEGGYWAREGEWDPLAAAFEGCSFYKLPRVLQWVSGNIGLHHIHHLLPRIPNYRLQRCYDEVPEVRRVAPLTLAGSLKSLRLHLWDEESRRLVGFGAVRGMAAG